jgi:predicted ATP-dependent Lon-type protease
LQLEQLSETSIKEFFIHVVDMIDSSSTAARARAMVALCNFLSKGKHRDKINMEGLVVLLPKLLRFLPADKNTVMNDDETYLAGRP